MHMKYDQLMNILRFEIAGDVEGTTYIYFLRAGMVVTAFLRLYDKVYCALAWNSIVWVTSPV